MYLNSKVLNEFAWVVQIIIDFNKKKVYKEATLSYRNNYEIVRAGGHNVRI